MDVHIQLFRKCRVGVLVVPLVMAGWLSAAIPSAERVALIALYNDTSGDGWHTNTGWKEPPLDLDGFAMPGTEGNWFGITVSSDHVTAIDLRYNNLDGALPPEIGDFAYLEALRIIGNNLPNPIPAQIGNLANLINLALQENGLTGAIPTEIGLCTSLMTLRLSQNQLSGNIPDEIGYCVNLSTLDLSTNQLWGTLPAAMGGLINLRNFGVAQNTLEGNLPAWLGTLTNLQELDLSDNAFTGSLPVEWSNLVNLRMLIISDNQITGTIPVWIDSLGALETLSLRDNPLLGEIPGDIGALTNLQLLNLSNCQLTGGIPAEIGNLSSLLGLYLRHNQLDGAIPAELGNLPLLQQLDLGDNQLSGNLPTELGYLTDLNQLDLGVNLLDGNLPVWLGDLTQLAHLSLERNDFSGPIPPEIGYLTNLYFINLSENNLTGSLPVELSNLTNLQQLHVYSNQISGTIPTWLGTLTQLIRLNLSYNQLLGSIPTQLGNLTALERLNLRNNLLTGGIPAEIGNLSSLLGLELRHNQLDGAIPAELGNLPLLQHLDLGDNQLSGNLPTELGSLTYMILLDLGGNLLDGNLPAWFSNMTQLVYLGLERNDFSGPIPPEIGYLTNLDFINLSENNLTGSLPVELANLTNLVELYLSDNDLTGGLPAWIGSLSQLRLLHVAQNSLTGPIPSELGTVTSLEQLYLRGNMFSGDIPASLANLVNLQDTETDIGYNALSTSDPALQAFLGGKDPDWADTQTVAPANVAAAPLTNSSVRVSWDPIPYAGDDGHYGVYVSATSGSGYSPAGATPDKSTGSLDVTGLDPSTPYYFVVETVTEPHGQNVNQVVSAYSAEASTATPASSVTVLSPNGGEDWLAGTVQSVTWSTSGTVGDVRIEYSTDSGGLWQEVAAATANDGAYDWTVPDEPSDLCLVRIYETDGDPLDVSDGAFTLSPPLPTITVTSPNGGEIWSVGLVHEITWTSSEYLGDVTIEYSTDGGGFWFLETPATPDDGSYLWIAPFASSQQCRVRVSRAAEPWISDESDWRFTLTDQDDAYEENDDQTAAAVIIPGVYSNLRLIMDDLGTKDADWFQVWVDEGQDLRVNVNGHAMDPDGADDMDFELRGADGTLLAAAIGRSGDETLYLADVAAGWYYIVVTFGENTSYTLTVETGGLPVGIISGQVTDEWGAGIAGVWVMFFDLTGSWETLYGYAPTDSAGNFAFSGLAEDYKILFNTSYPNLNYLPEWYDDCQEFAAATVVSIVAGQTTDGIDAQLVTGGIISGVVTQSGGVPFNNVRVRAYGDDATRRLGEARTGTDGTYVMNRLAPGDVRVQFYDFSAGFGLEWYDDQPLFAGATVLPLTAGGVFTGIDAELGTPPGGISGRVTNGDGTGIAAVWVAVYDPANVWLYDGATDADGYYSVGGLPAGDLKVWFQAWYNTAYQSEWYDDQPDFSSATPVPVIQGQTTPDIDAVLAPRAIQLTSPNGDEIWSVGLTHEITWLASEDVAGIRIEFSDDDGITWGELVGATTNDGVYEWDTLAGPAAYCRLRVSDAAHADVFDTSDGPFTLTDQDDAYEENDTQAAAVELTPGVYPDLRHIMDDWLTMDTDWFRVWVDEGQDLRVNVNGHAMDPDGADDMDFELRGADGTLLAAAIGRSGDETLYLADVAAGWYYIVVTFGENTSYTLTVETGGLPVGIISGQVTDEWGAGIAGVWVMFFDLTGSWETLYGYAPTDSAGNFAFSGLAEDYKILFNTSYPNLNYLPEWYDDCQEFAAATVVSIVAGQTTDGIDAQLVTGGIISGVVTQSGGVPFNNVRVRAYGDDATRRLGEARTGTDGTYVMNRLAPGDVRVQFYDFSAGFGLEWYDDQPLFAGATVLPLTAGGVFTGIDAELGTPPGGISGRVTNGDGTGIAAVWVAVYDPANVWLYDGATDADGYYSVGGLPAGDLKVWFQAWYNTAYQSEWYDDQPDFSSATPVPVIQGQTTPDIDAVLAPRAIQLTSPNGDEIWSVGLTHEITWLASEDVAGIRIEFSNDDGITWGELVGATTNDGVYEWDTLAGPAAYCRLRVSDAANADVFDTSDGPFTLTDQDDAYEENDSQAAAVELTPGVYPDLRMVVDDQGRLDPDWFKVWLDAGQDLRVTIDATLMGTTNWDDIDFELRDEAGNLLVGALGSSTYEILCLADMPAGWYYIATNYAESLYDYTLTIETGTLDVGLITGRVTDEYGAGIASLWVEFEDPSHDRVYHHGYVLTGADGYYSFAGNSGEYLILFNPAQTNRNYLVEWYDDQPTGATAAPVSITPGGVTAPVDAQLATGGSISGVVTQSGGAPFYYVRVRAYAADGTLLRTVRTGTDGTYVMNGVAPGDVRVQFARTGFGLEWYDDQPLFAGATVLPVTAGGVFTGIDAELGTPPGGISGRVTNGDGAGVADVRVLVYDPANVALMDAGTDADGYYSVGVLPAGDLKVWFQAGETVYQSEWYDNQPDFSSATLVPVIQGQATPDIDAVLARCALTITAQPPNRQVTAGQTATLSVTAASELPLSYQWYEGYAPDTARPVGGATDPVFVTPPLAATTSYWVHVSNGCREAASTTATVWVVNACQPPPAPVLSVPGTVGNGQSYTINWTGTSPLGTYELHESTSPNFGSAAAWLVTGTGFQQSHVVAADTYYYYRVRAYVTCNGSRLDSPWSDIEHVAVRFGALEPADLDGNGLITAEDMMLLAAYLCGDIDLVNGGDLNGDGRVDATDLSYMLHFLTGTFK